MKIVYCANCGTKLQITQKALPKYGTVISIVEHHICPDEPIELDLKPIINDAIPSKMEGKFVKKINDLEPVRSTSSIGGLSTNDLRDRRFEQTNDTKIKSTAPKSLLNMIDDLSPTKPDKELIEHPEE